MPGMTIFASTGLLPQLATHFVSAAWPLATANIPQPCQCNSLFQPHHFAPLFPSRSGAQTIRIQNSDWLGTEESDLQRPGNGQTECRQMTMPRRKRTIAGDFAVPTAAMVIGWQWGRRGQSLGGWIK